MFWHIDNTIITIAIFVMTLFVHLFYAKYFLYKHWWHIVFFAIVAILLGTHGNINNYIFSVINIFPFLSFMFLKDEFKKCVFDSWRNVFSAIIAVSLVLYLLVTGGVNLPSFPDFYGDITDADSYYLARNYIGLIQLVNAYSGDILDRFQSIFLEPGYLACLIVMILFIDGYSFKERKSNIILFIALILTFSLAGYFLCAVFYVVYMVKNSRHRYASVFGLFFVTISFLLLASIYNGGDNQINNRVISRLQYDNDRGTIEGYNRTTQEFDEYFSNFMLSSDVLMGDAKGFERNFAGEGANVGIKYYIVVYGMAGLLSYLLFLYSPFFRMTRKSYLALSFFVLWFIIFARGNYVMWMTAFLITYIYGLISLNENKKMKLI